MGFVPTTKRTPVIPYAYTPPPGATRTVLVAGASGRLGRQVVRELKQRGYRVRAMSRNPLRLATLAGEMDSALRGDLSEPESLVGACAGTDVIISCVGASLSPHDAELYPRFHDVDLRGTANLLRIAREAEVSRFVCIAPHSPERLLRSEYGAAREEMVKMVEDSGLPCTTVRPTMMFGLCAAILPLVARGQRWLLGDATHRVNAIDERDVAELCVGAVTSDASEIDAGGPETLTLAEMADQMMDALGCPSAIHYVPSWGCRAASALLRPFRPRQAALLDLAAAYSGAPNVAPALGRRRWAEYLSGSMGALATRISSSPSSAGSKVGKPDSRV